MIRATSYSLCVFLVAITTATIFVRPNSTSATDPDGPCFFFLEQYPLREPEIEIGVQFWKDGMPLEDGDCCPEDPPDKMVVCIANHTSEPYVAELYEFDYPYRLRTFKPLPANGTCVITLASINPVGWASCSGSGPDVWYSWKVFLNHVNNSKDCGANRFYWGCDKTPCEE